MAKDTAKIIVGCKLPHGLHLDTPGLERITLAGGNDPSAVGGYGITNDVDRSVFEAWVKANSQHPALKNNQIFIANDYNSARDNALEQAKIPTGFEGIDPNDLPPGIETAETQKMPG